MIMRGTSVADCWSPHHDRLVVTLGSQGELVDTNKRDSASVQGLSVSEYLRKAIIPVFDCEYLQPDMN